MHKKMLICTIKIFSVVEQKPEAIINGHEIYTSPRTPRFRGRWKVGGIKRPSMMQHVRSESWIPTRNTTGISPPVKKSSRPLFFCTGSHQPTAYTHPCCWGSQVGTLPPRRWINPLADTKEGGSILLTHFFSMYFFFFIWAIAIKLTQSKMKFFKRRISFYYDPRNPEIGI